MIFFLSLTLIILGGVVLFYLCKIIYLPQLVGYLLWGILLGFLSEKFPSFFSLEILNISSHIKKIALIIILIKAGLTLNVSDLKKVGRPAILMSFLPAVVEMCAVGIFGKLLFPSLTYVETFLLGSVLGAVSPAVVVPFMSKLMEEKRGTEKGVPQLIIAGSSIDDIIMIVFYQIFMTMEKGGSFSAMTFLNIPISIISGVGLGLLFGYLFHLLFSKTHMRDSMKLILVFAISFGTIALEEFLSQYFVYSSLLTIISMCVFLNKTNAIQAKRLAVKTNKMWILAEMFLFVLVGMSIKIEYAGKYFLLALALIAISLTFRSIAVYLANIKTGFNMKEKSFIILSYLPKATVQAAIGSGLLDYGNTLLAHEALNASKVIAAGEIVLSVSVVAILVTAPLAATLMSLLYKRLLTDNSLERIN